MSIRELIEKATVANVVAAIVVVTAVAATVYYQQWELLSFIVGGAVGYLFPKQAA